MKQFFGSIANRVFVILLAGILSAAGVTTWLASHERETAIDDMRVVHNAERIEQLVHAIDKAPPLMRPVILNTAANLGVNARIIDSVALIGESDNALVRQLKARLGPGRRVVLQAQTACPPRPDRGTRLDRYMSTDCPVVLVQLADDHLLRIQLRGPLPLLGGRPRLLWGTPTTYLILFLVLIALLAYAVAQMTARPIRRLADAAGALGSDLDRPPLSETGPSEIRRAASAFNAMQARIRRQVQHRTHMLAAITHDLQTPLTRLRLRLEKVSDADLRTKLIDDLGLMHAMVREGLDLARSMDSQEQQQRLDIDSLVDSVCADASDAGHDVSLQGSAGGFVMAQPNALRRCLTNLLDNAINYGKSAQVDISRDRDRVVIRIHDAGPGLPPAQLEVVFDPFFRLESSRSRETGGTGLGLTIARNIADSHGGSLVLRNHPDGGLVAELMLPVKVQ